MNEVFSYLVNSRTFIKGKWPSCQRCRTERTQSYTLLEGRQHITGHNAFGLSAANECKYFDTECWESNTSSSVQVLLTNAVEQWTIAHIAVQKQSLFASRCIISNVFWLYVLWHTTQTLVKVSLQFQCPKVLFFCFCKHDTHLIKIHWRITVYEMT